MRVRPGSLLEPDGLILPDVGEWAETKYRLVELFAGMFSKAMQGKWERVYIDLFAAAGWAHVKGTSRIVRGTAFRALGVEPPFDRYVLCDADPDHLNPLKTRVQRDFPRSDVRYVLGDCNDAVDRVIAELPEEGRSRSALTFCVVDPYNTSELRFATLERLASIAPEVDRRIDFLVLIPSYMDANRGRDYYLDPNSTRLADFLGNPDWRATWQEEVSSGHARNFGVFLVDMFGKSMQRLGYDWDLNDAILIRGPQSKYHLAFFSRHPLGRKFAREARKYASAQRDFFQ